MPIKPKIKLVKCGRCGKQYNNPFTHVCKIGFSQAGQRKVAKRKKKGGW